MVVNSGTSVEVTKIIAGVLALSRKRYVVTLAFANSQEYRPKFGSRKRLASSRFHHEACRSPREWPRCRWPEPGRLVAALLLASEPFPAVDPGPIAWNELRRRRRYKHLLFAPSP